MADQTSATGFSQFCQFGAGISGRLPCALDDGVPPPSPLLVGADLNVSTDDVPVCSAQQRNTYDQIITESLGVTGSDVDGAYIMDFPVEKFAWNDNWYPNDVYKQTMCGKLQRFGVFDGDWPDPGEMDWNLFTIPSPPYVYLFTDVVDFEGGITDLWDEWSKCGDVSLCIEGEITPDEHLYENPWFRKSTKTSPLEEENGRGPEVCMYGPWVREWAHAYKPEIHPSELIWWKEGRQFAFNAESWWLMQVDDDSNRFDVNSEYDFGWPWSDPPAGWRPWSSAPRQNMFNFPFRTSTTSGRTTFSIVQAADTGESEDNSSRNIVTPSVHVGIQKDNSTQRIHRLRYNNRTVAQIVESDRADPDVAVGFLGLCRNSDNTQLQAVLRIGTAVSRNNNGQEGYHVLNVTKSMRFDFERPPSTGSEEGPQQPAAPTLLGVSSADVDTADRAVDVVSPSTLRTLRVQPQRVSVSTAAAVASLDVARFDRERTLTADLAISVDAEEGDTPSIVSATAIVNGVQKNVDFRTDQGGRVFFDNFPVIGTETIELRLESGKTLKVSTGGISLAAVREEMDSTVAEVADERRAWQAVARSVAGADAVVPAELPKLSRVESVSMEARPRYGPLVGGRVRLEDSSLWSKAANEALTSGSAAEVRGFFGSRNPIDVSWEFTAYNLHNRQKVPVNTGRQAGAGEVHAEIDDGEIRSNRLRLTYPSGSDDVYEVVALVRMQDQFGSQSTAVYRFSNYFVEVASRDDGATLLNTIGALNNLDAAKLASDARTEGLPTLPDLWEFGLYTAARDPQLRRARMANLYLRQSAQDNRLTVGELSGLSTLAELYKNGQVTQVTPYRQLMRSMDAELRTAQ